MKTYKQVKLFNFFVIKGEFGDSDFEKVQTTERGNSICIRSENGTYQKGTIYFIQDNQEVMIYE